MPPSTAPERSLALCAVLRLVRTTFALNNSPLCSPPYPRPKPAEGKLSHWEARPESPGLCVPTPALGAFQMLGGEGSPGKYTKAGERGRWLAGQELSQTHGETLPRIKGNMTFEKNVHVCLCSGGGALGGVRGSRGWIRVSTRAPPASAALLPRHPPLGWRLVAGIRVFLALLLVGLLPLFPR